jgi:uncharacterized protein with von Willebrand factor type A (vWA) domain
VTDAAVEAGPGAPGLVDRMVMFVQALRRAEVPVSTAESVDAVRAIGIIDLLDRDGLRATLAATLCKRPAYRQTFDGLFELYFPARLGDGLTTSDEELSALDGDALGIDPEDIPEDATDEEMRALLRDALLRALLDGDPDLIKRLAREAVRRLGRVQAQPGRQTWFAYKVLRAMSPDTLIAPLLDLMLQGAEKGGLAEKVARTTIAERIKAFEQAVESEVRRRVAEERGIEAVEKTAVKPLADQVDFLRASRADLAELKREVYPLARRLATRLTAKRRHGESGRLDFRRTVRASLGYGGVPLETHWKPRKPHKPELVVLCDVSGSVSSFAHFTLLLTHALREQFAKVRAFAFIDTTDEVTRFFGPDADLADVMTRVQNEADVVWLDGHSDYGHAFEIFEERYPDAVGPKTSLLILGDARTNHRHPGTDTLRRVSQMARHTYWLNPEPRSYWGGGDSATWSYEPLVDEMVECRNAAQLSEFVERILPH